MRTVLNSLSGLTASSGLLIGQLTFSTFFVGTCEIPNFMSGNPTTSACLERWMTVSALFFPSGVGTKAVTTETLPSKKRRFL